MLLLDVQVLLNINTFDSKFDQPGSKLILWTEISYLLKSAVLLSNIRPQVKIIC